MPHNFDSKATFQGFKINSYRSRNRGESFRANENAKNTLLISPSTSMEPPLISEFRKGHRSPILEIGILNNVKGIYRPSLSTHCP